MRKLWLLLAAATVATAGCGDSGTTGTGGGGTGAGNTGGGGTGGSTTTMSTTSSTGGAGTGGSTTSNMDVCGDGTITGSEACDDGNTTAGDGCDGSCVVENGYVCTGEPSACATDCGDGIIAGTEACDDGNSVAGDGCDMTCVVEHGFLCNGEPSACASDCSDGIVASDEGCDDGNLTAGDGCDDACVVEAGWTCSGEPTGCTETGCGDGIQVGVEACDDGNMTDGDGCSAGCQVEAGFDCTGTAPTTCAPICGDGTVVAGEECDDGNTAGGDCCSSTCQVEAGCEIEANNTTVTANDFSAVSITDTVHGFIDPVGDADYFAITIPAGANATITAETSDGILGSVCASSGVPGIDSRIRLFDSSGSTTPLASNDDTAANYCSLLTSGSLVPGTYYIVVDASTSAGTNDDFDYDLTITVNPIVCGDGQLEPGEQCDDGNLTAGDGCSATCTIECPGTQEVEMNGTSATATAIATFGVGNCGAIQPVADADFWSFTLTSYSDVRIEEFDATGTTCTSIDPDATLIAPNGTTTLISDDFDGVNNCALINPAVDAQARHLAPGTYYVKVNEFGNDATITGYQLKVTLVAQCGNGTVEGSEECDGGATCAADCQRIPTCGDGFIDAPETCDDTNTTSGDGCSSACAVESGYTCSGSPSVCTGVPNATCADPIVVTGNTFQYAGTQIDAYGDTENYNAGTGCVDVSTTLPSGADMVFRIDALAGDKIRLRELGLLDAVLHILTQPSCGAGTACAASSDFSETTGITYTAPADGPVYLVVEAYGNPSPSTTFDVRIDREHCGDGIVTASETCDDGNATAGDGCSATCGIENGFACDGTSCFDVSACTTLACYLGPCSGTVVTGSAAGVPAAIPDNQPSGGATLTIPIAASGTITKMAMRYDITHTWDGDLGLYLTGPNGVAPSDLCSGNGSSGANFTNTFLRDSVFRAVTSGSAPFAGVYRPETAFSAFNGQSVTGDWTLRVSDSANGDTGTVNAWDIAFCVTP